VQVLGDRVGLFESAKVDASGGSGGGEVLVGGDYLGKNPGVPNAKAVLMGSEATIVANSTANGNGGRVILWSDKYTGFFGDISVEGGPMGGDGGFVETSSGKEVQIFGNVSAWATRGTSGLWLIDPYNYTIGSSQATSIGTALASSNVEITTSSDVSAYGSSGSNSDTGNITINSDITGSLGSLTLTAAGTIYLNANISTAGSQTFNSNVIVSAASAQLNSTNNSSAGGNITFAGTINGSSANANSLFILSGAGAITVAGNIGSTTALSYLGLGGTGTYVPGSTQNFTSTGAQTFTASVSGAYTFQTWGAQGGNGLNTTGGKGGYATGTYSLAAGDQIYVYVGGAGAKATSGSALGAGWNGGGNGGIDTGASQHGGGGGGATDIRVGGTALANRVIVAGGGAGGRGPAPGASANPHAKPSAAVAPPVCDTQPSTGLAEARGGGPGD
jgi:hypothetical protein